MQCFYPKKLTLSANLPLQTQLEDKVGGLPWGLPIEKYPICCDCGRSQSLIAQLVHHPQRLDLGKLGRTLLVFHCNRGSTCAAWEGGYGANACLIIEPEELTDKPTPLPPDAPPLEVDARILAWEMDDDGIPAERVAADGRVLGVSSHTERMNFYDRFFIE